MSNHLAAGGPHAVDVDALILAVDDRPANLIALERTLAGLPVRVIKATSGEEALAAALRHRFALAILDVQMPGMDGYELAEILLADPESAGTPIIFVTAAYADDHHRFKGYSSGAVDYLVKPYDPSILMSKVRVFLELARHRQGLVHVIEQRTRELQASEARYRAIFESARDGMMVFDEETLDVQMSNGAMLCLLGKDAASDEAPVEILSRERLAALRDRARAPERGPEGGTEVVLLRPDGEPIYVDVRVTPLDLRARRCLLAVFRDVTERRRAEQTRERLQSELTHAQKMESVGLLAGGIAHDFNNLLTVILAYVASAIEREDTHEETREDLCEVQEAGHRAAALVRKLLAFGRKQVMERTPVDVNGVARGVEKILQRIIGEDIDLSLQLAPDLGLVNADAGQLEQVIMNLAVNARDAMPGGGVLLFTTANVDVDDATVARNPGLTAGPRVRLSVSDTGTGIDAETLSRIFEPFFTTKAKDKGTGLGLSTVYGIVKQSGGDIHVASEVGKGTTFTVYLPRIARIEVQAQPRLEAHTGVRGGDETILVVEDAETVRTLTVRMLRAVGYNVLTAADGVEALHVCEREGEAIDLVLTDVVMPRMGGEEFVARFVRDHPDARVLFMSGYTGAPRPEFSSFDARRHLIEKPFRVAELLQRVRGALDDPPAKWA
jgi:two-component system, cell cycle sensor histidine kinase and response regulator CckA